MAQLIRKAKNNSQQKKQAKKERHEQYDLIIIGAGVAGLAGAMYAGRMNMKTLIIGDVPVGGVITLTDVVENYPGFKRLTGLELADKIKEHALEYKIDPSPVTMVEEFKTMLAGK